MHQTTSAIAVSGRKESFTVNGLQRGRSQHFDLCSFLSFGANHRVRKAGRSDPAVVAGEIVCRDSRPKGAGPPAIILYVGRRLRRLKPVLKWPSCAISAWAMLARFQRRRRPGRSAARNSRQGPRPGSCTMGTALPVERAWPRWAAEAAATAVIAALPQARSHRHRSVHCKALRPARPGVAHVQPSVLADPPVDRTATRVE